MSLLLQLVASNLAVAALLATLAWSSGWLRRPALTHGLWLLVLLKLLTPPLVPVTVFETVALSVPLGPSRATSEANPAGPATPLLAGPAPVPADSFADGAGPPVAAIEPAVVGPMEAMPEDTPLRAAELPGPEPTQPADAVPVDWSWLPLALVVPWLTGSVVWLAFAARRLIRFHRLLRHAEPAPEHLRGLASDLAKRLGIACPGIVLVPGVVSPLLWALGRPRLVLPASLVERLSSEQWLTLLAHELAHWRRRDHLVRWLEMLVLALYWWCPLAWWARRSLQQAEEECCDAWVVWTLPDAARAYALALVETTDFLSSAPAALPPAASGIGHVHLLKRRLTMILRGTTPRALSVTGFAVVLLLGALVLPWMPTWAQAQPRVPQPPQPPGSPAPPVAQRPTPAYPDQPPGPQDRDDVKDEVARLQREVNRLHEEMGKLQAQLNEKRGELEQKHRRMNEMMQRLGRGGPGFAPGQFPPGGAPGGAAPQPPRSGFGGGVAGGFGTTFGPRPDLERRIDALERKVDDVLNELRGQRGKVAPPATPVPKKQFGRPSVPPADPDPSQPLPKTIRPAPVAPVAPGETRPSRNDDSLAP
jgi:beta-lactamase regulating signal transducer with metallopeptidase domain